MGARENWRFRGVACEGCGELGGDVYIRNTNCCERPVCFERCIKKTWDSDHANCPCCNSLLLVDGTIVDLSQELWAIHSRQPRAGAWDVFFEIPTVNGLYGVVVRADTEAKAREIFLAARLRPDLLAKVVLYPGGPRLPRKKALGKLERKGSEAQIWKVVDRGLSPSLPFTDDTVLAEVDL